MNEEEIKVKYVLPWLQKSGVALNELQLERSFSVHIGRRSIDVGTTSITDSAGARLDILVRRGERNLLIVEVKAEHISLTADDRDQAISYARLVHPIAPYAVVTNGSEYHLYDVITKERLDPADIEIGDFELVLPECDIAEAQRLFLTLNRNNLIAFCKQQVERELALVKGTLGGPRKYIPELHVRRNAVQAEVSSVFSSAQPGILITGQSGLGKTCEMCAIAESLLQRREPVLFFNGFSLGRDILDAIAAEFSWTFSGLDVPTQLLRRAASLVGDGFLTIIVDAIDEWTSESRVNSLAALLRAAEICRVRVILSCKTSSVDRFLTCRDNQTQIDTLARRVELRGFSSHEFEEVVHTYRREYRFFGGFEDAVLQAARENPFVLRVLFDVAMSSNSEHLTFSSVEFFDAYYQRAICRTSDADRRRAETTLIEVAQLLYDRDVDWMSERDVRTSLRMGVNESLMEELFEFSMLVRSDRPKEEPSIGFYFQQFRDYIIAYKVRRFNGMSTTQVADEFRSVSFPSMRGDVLVFYYRLASLEHKSVFDGELRKNAASYLHAYRSILQHHFPSLIRHFRPETDGSVGFIGELLFAARRVGLHGFRAIGPTDDDVCFVPVQTMFGKQNLSYLSGAGSMHWFDGANGFRDGINVVAEVVEHEVLEQIRQLVGHGRLNESNNSDLLSEQITRTILRHKDIFKRLLTAGNREIAYPLELDEVINCLRRERLRLQFRHEAIEKMRLSGALSTQRHGDIVTYSHSPSMLDEAQIMSDVEQALQSGSDPESRIRFLDLEEIGIPVTTAVDYLRASRVRIDAPWHNGQDCLTWAMQHGMPVPRGELEAYVTKLYSAFLRNYKTLVETNFPTVKDSFALYSKLPVAIHLVIGPTERREFGGAQTELKVYFSKSTSGQCEIEVVDEVAYDRRDDSLCFTVGGVEFKGFLVSWTFLELLFWGPTPGLTGADFTGMALRALVYSKIADELPVVEDVFRARQGYMPTE